MCRLKICGFPNCNHVTRCSTQYPEYLFILYSLHCVGFIQLYTTKQRKWELIALTKTTYVYLLVAVAAISFCIWKFQTALAALLRMNAFALERNSAYPLVILLYSVRRKMVKSARLACTFAASTSRAQLPVARVVDIAAVPLESAHSLLNNTCLASLLHTV